MSASQLFGSQLYEYAFRMLPAGGGSSISSRKPGVQLFVRS